MRQCDTIDTVIITQIVVVISFYADQDSAAILQFYNPSKHDRQLRSPAIMENERETESLLKWKSCDFDLWSLILINLISQNIPYLYVT